MNRIKEIVAEANFSNRAFPVGTEYASWETDEVIEGEFWRNMGISLLCVFMIVFVVVPEWCASRTAMTAMPRPRARSPEIA